MSEEKSKLDEWLHRTEPATEEQQTEPSPEQSGGDSPSDKETDRVNQEPERSEESNDRGIDNVCEPCCGTGLKFTNYQDRMLSTETCPYCEGSGRLDSI